MAENNAPEGEIIVTLESTEKRYSFDQLGVNFESGEDEIIDAIAPVILEEEGINIKEEGSEGVYAVKKIEESGNVYLFPKSVAG